ncbi:hypothetical protein HYW58_02750 [Candidatus Kaiserbacteria bacterium]|nr:hypothetical protein [Candidatus Kaiserbacteria bacterium]
MNRTFLHFLFGFLAILLLSFVVTGIVAQYSDDEIVDKDTQIACQQTNSC